MWEFWLIVGVVVVFLVWAARRVGRRSGGPGARDDRERRTDGYFGGGGAG